MTQVIINTYTCDICGIAVPETTVISYKITCAVTGTGAASFEGLQVYGCTAAHAVQAAQNSLNALEAQRAKS